MELRISTQPADLTESETSEKRPRFAWSGLRIAGAVSARRSPYLQVFRVAGTVAFLAYSGAHVPGAIWFGRPLGSALKEVADGLLYGLLTAGAFGWLWPR
jgi:hypothetical protein